MRCHRKDTGIVRRLSATLQRQRGFAALRGNLQQQAFAQVARADADGIERLHQLAGFHHNAERIRRMQSRSRFRKLRGLAMPVGCDQLQAAALQSGFERDGFGPRIRLPSPGKGLGQLFVGDGQVSVRIQVADDQLYGQTQLRARVSEPSCHSR